MDSALLEGEEKIALGARITEKQAPCPSEAPRETQELWFQGRQVPRRSTVVFAWFLPGPCSDSQADRNAIACRLYVAARQEGPRTSSPSSTAGDFSCSPHIPHTPEGCVAAVCLPQGPSEGRARLCHVWFGSCSSYRCDLPVA